MNHTIMHINYGETTYNHYGSNTIDSICKMAANIGFDGIEFRGNPPAEFKNIPFVDYVKQIAECKKKYGLSEVIFAIGLLDCTSHDKDKRENSILAAIEKAKIANELCGTTTCNTFASRLTSGISTAPANCYEFHGSAVASQEDWGLTVDAFQQVGYELERIGVKFAFETHMFHIHDLPAATKKLVDAINSPVIGVNMDFGNIVYFPEHPSLEETIELYGDKLFYTHLKNSTAAPGSNTRIATALGEGDINHRSYLSKLKGAGFGGPIGIEAPRPGDRVWYAQQDYLYFKSVMETIW